MDSFEPKDLPKVLTPKVLLVMLPRNAVEIFGPFEESLMPLLGHRKVPTSVKGDTIVVPCLAQQFPLLHHFVPQARLLDDTPNDAFAQASLRTASVVGYELDIKFPLTCRITFGQRSSLGRRPGSATDHYAKAAGPRRVVGVWRNCSYHR